MNFHDEYVGQVAHVVEGYLSPTLRTAQILSELPPIRAPESSILDVMPRIKRFFFVVGGTELGLELGKDLFFSEQSAREELARRL